MRVKMLVGGAIEDEPHEAGDILDVPEDQGRQWMQAGIAVDPNQPSQPDPNAPGSPNPTDPGLEKPETIEPISEPPAPDDDEDEG